MKIIRDSDDTTINESVVTIGAFDGVHIGHQTVIQEVMDRAAARATVTGGSSIERKCSFRFLGCLGKPRN